MDTPLLWTVIPRFLGAFAVFWLPGYGLATWLHPTDRLGWPWRCALGFAWSFTVFSLISLPFLWCQLSFQAFLLTLGLVWCLFLLGVGTLTLHTWRTRVGTFMPGDGFAPPSPECDPIIPGHVFANRAWILFLSYLAILLAVGFVYCGNQGAYRPSFLQLLPVLLLGASLAAYWFRSVMRPLLTLGPEDEQPAPRLWTAAAVGLILLQAVSAAIYVRADWDDCFYLAVVLDYEQADTLNEQEPTHREGFAIPSIYWTLCWELWGAVLCRLSGASPMTVFHTLLPGLLVLLSYAAYGGLLSSFLPRRWVPLALLGLSAYHLWGISSHWTAANHFLPRLWQGKSVLLHIGVPLTATALMSFAREPNLRQWSALAIALLFGLAVSLSALFMGVVLVACLTLALIPWIRVRRLAFLGGVVLAVVPLLVGGLILRVVFQDDQVLNARPAYMASWSNYIFFHTYYGSAEIVWLLSLPLLIALLMDWWQGVYLIGFPLVLALTFGNPLFFELVAGQLTSFQTYYRVLWLFPIGPGLGVLLALSVRYLTRDRSPLADPCSNWLPLAVTGAGLAWSWLFPSIYVWGPRNSFIGPHGEPHLAANMDKMPADLVPIAQLLARDPDALQWRILCDEETASFLTPYSRNLRFVQTRPFYTCYYLSLVGRPAEGLERYLLGRLLQNGRLSNLRSPSEWKELRNLWGKETLTSLFADRTKVPTQADAGTLLKRYRVKYIVAGPLDKPGEVFQAYGYRVSLKRGAYTLWQAPSVNANPPSTYQTRKTSSEHMGD